MIRQILLVFCLLFLAQLKAGKDYTDTFTLGANGNTTNKTLLFNSSGEGRIRWLDASNKLQYSNDSGSTYIDFTDSIRNLTSGPILFGDTDGSIAQDGNNLFYDNTNNRLGLGTGSPNYTLDVAGQAAFGSQTILAGSGGLELINHNNIQFYESTGSGTDKITMQAPTTLAASYTLNLPTSIGNANNRLVTDGSGNSSWRSNDDLMNVNQIVNTSLTVTQSGGALTITLLGSQGVNLSSSNVAVIAFRDNVITTGRTYPALINSNQTLVVPTGATLGNQGLDYPQRLYIYAVYQTGNSIELAVSGTLFNEKNILATTAISGSSTSLNVLYANNAVSANSIRLIGWADTSYQASTTHWATPTLVMTATNQNLIDETPKENYLDNPGFIISQRGDYSTTFTSAPTNTYFLDRWKTDIGTVTGQFQNLSAPPNTIDTKTQKTIDLRAQTTGTGYVTMFQPIEDSSAFYGKVITISGWLKSNSNKARMLVFDGTNYLGGNLNNHSGSGKWEYISATFIGSNAGSWKFYIGLIGATPGTANQSLTAGDQVEFTALKMEISAYPTKYVARTPWEEMNRCLRFAYVPIETVGGSATHRSLHCPLMYYATALKESHWWCKMPMPMRAQPTIGLTPGTASIVYNTDYGIRNQVNDAAFTDGNDAGVTILGLGGTFGDQNHGIDVRLIHQTATIADTFKSFYIYNTRKIVFTADL